MAGFGYCLFVVSVPDLGCCANVTVACASTSKTIKQGLIGHCGMKSRQDFLPRKMILEKAGPLHLHPSYRYPGCRAQSDLNVAVFDSLDEAVVTDYSSHLPAKPSALRIPAQDNKGALVVEEAVQDSFSGSMQSFSTYSSGSSCGQSYKVSEELQSLCEQGQLDKALQVLFHMDRESVIPSVNVYRSLLKVCSKQKALAHAKRVHTHLEKHGLESTSYLGESVVNTLIKCGSIEDALHVFQRLRCPTVVSWTAVLSGYVMSGQGQEALRIYHAMREEGVQPNKYTLLSLIKACGMIGDLQEGKAIYSEAVNFRFDSDMFVGTGLVDMYVKCGSIVDAQAVFDTLAQRDVVSWTAMVAGYAKDGQGEKALQLFQQMQEEGIDGNERTFVSLLQACSSLAEEEQVCFVGKHLVRAQSLRRGKELHAEARRKGYETNFFVGSSLVSMYAKCGSIGDAMIAFGMLSTQDVVSWNTMIGAYAQQELAEDALELYKNMLQEGVRPDAHTFVSVLQACSSLADKEISVVVDGQLLSVDILAKGKWIHYAAWRADHQSDVFVGNALISLYGKVQSILDAENVFEGLPKKNIVSYNAMLAAYAQQGQPKEALQLYGRMLEEGWSPDDRTFVSVIQACSMLAEMQDSVDQASMKEECLWKGKALHAEAARNGYGTNVFVVNTLICMYGKCGIITDVLNVFHELPEHDVISWRLTLAACAQQGQPDEALLLYGHMLEAAVSPDERTYVSVLQACGISAENEGAAAVDGQTIKVESLQKVKAIHAEAWRMGCKLVSDEFLSSSLVNTYGRCGSIVDAQNVFNMLSEWDIVTWTAMFMAYSQQGQPEKALRLYSQMLEEGLSPDDRSFVGAIQACCILADKEEYAVVDGLPMKVKSLYKVRAIHAHARQRGYQVDVFVCNTLVSMYGRCGSLVDAEKVFNGLPHPTVVSWNVMLAAYVHESQPDKALQLYQRMMVEGVTPDEMTYMCVLQACGDTGTLDVCTQIHHTLVSTRKDLDLLLGSTLIHTYGRCASMVEARNVFDALPQPDVVSWNTLLAGYARQGNHVEVLQCFEEMLLRGTKPDGVTFVAILSACSHAGLVDTGIEYFESMSRDYGITPQNQHYANMVDLLGRAGFLTLVEDLLSKMPTEPNQSMWLCLLAACRKHCNVGLAEYAFDMAVRQDQKQASAYVLMSTIYAQAGMWDHAKKVYDLKQQAGAWKQPGQSWIFQEQELHMFVVSDHNHEQDDGTQELLENLDSELQKGNHLENMEPAP